MSQQPQLDPILYRLSRTVAESKDIETLVRPVLELLEAVTGLETTYLTLIDENENLQKVLFSRNSHRLQIPEGLSVPWADTLCKRALDSGITYTTEVPKLWGDSSAAQELGIQTYVLSLFVLLMVSCTAPCAGPAASRLKSMLSSSRC